MSFPEFANKGWMISVEISKKLEYDIGKSFVIYKII